MTLVERLNVNRWNDPRLKAKFAQASADEMGTETSFHADNAPWKRIKRSLQCKTLNLSSQNDLAGSVKADQVKHVLADVETDDRKVFKTFLFLGTHGCLSLLHG